MDDVSADNNHWVPEVKDYWLSMGIRLQVGAHLKEIDKIESLIGFIFPSDMRELYQCINGFENFDWTPGMISIWPIERIRDEYLAGPDRDFVGICDFLINSHCIGFLKDRPGLYKNYGNFPIEFIAESFQQLIGLINNDSELIY